MVYRFSSTFILDNLQMPVPLARLKGLYLLFFETEVFSATPVQFYNSSLVASFTCAIRFKWARMRMSGCDQIVHSHGPQTYAPTTWKLFRHLWLVYVGLNIEGACSTFYAYDYMFDPCWLLGYVQWLFIWAKVIDFQFPQIIYANMWPSIFWLR